MASNHIVMQFFDVRQIGRKGLYDNKLAFFILVHGNENIPKVA